MPLKELADYKKKDDKDDKKKTTSYAGGEKSGIAVENHDAPDNHIENIIKKAKEGSKKDNKDGPPKTELKITLYSNGFVVGENGTFRDYEAPENKEFMKELNDGYVPNEIRGKYKDGVSVGLEDRRKDTYRPPTPPKYTAYSGSGMSMGGGSAKGTGLTVDKTAGGLPAVDESQPKTTI